MIFNAIKRPRRRAATIVEAALVLPIMLLLLFGLFEYCRFIFLLQVAENAAREGARYAVVHTGDGTTTTDVQNTVRSRMFGRDIELSGMQITVDNVDPSTGALIPNTTWTDAPFAGAVRVRITGTYSPILPGFLKRQSAIPITVTCAMSSEAN